MKNFSLPVFFSLIFSFTAGASAQQLIEANEPPPSVEVNYDVLNKLKSHVEMESVKKKNFEADQKRQSANYAKELKKWEKQRAKEIAQEEREQRKLEALRKKEEKKLQAQQKIVQKPQAKWREKPKSMQYGHLQHHETVVTEPKREAVVAPKTEPVRPLVMQAEPAAPVMEPPVIVAPAKIAEEPQVKKAESLADIVAEAEKRIEQEEVYKKGGRSLSYEIEDESTPEASSAPAPEVKKAVRKSRKKEKKAKEEKIIATEQPPAHEEEKSTDIILPEPITPEPKPVASEKLPEVAKFEEFKPVQPVINIHPAPVAPPSAPAIQPATPAVKPVPQVAPIVKAPETIKPSPTPPAAPIAVHPAPIQPAPKPPAAPAITPISPITPAQPPIAAPIGRPVQPAPVQPVMPPVSQQPIPPNQPIPITPVSPAPATEQKISEVKPTPEPSPPAALAALNKSLAVRAKKEELLNIEFPKNNTDISADATSKIDALVNDLKNNTGKRIVIISYASSPDNQTSSARRISLKRALSVRKHMIDNGIENSRISVQALGNNVTGEGALDRISIMAN